MEKTKKAFTLSSQSECSRSKQNIAMYNLPDFKCKEPNEVIDFMHAHPFITLTGADAEHKPVATHIPVLIELRDDKLFIAGHIMKHTDHHRAFEYNRNVLAIFTGPHAYVSASWYRDPLQASTWNYTAVHARGILHFLDQSMLPEILRKTTALFENDAHSPSLVEKMPAGYVERLCRAIVAFELEVMDFDHVFKLSQNKDTETYKMVVNKLNAGQAADKQVAGLMEKNLQK